MARVHTCGFEENDPISTQSKTIWDVTIGGNMTIVSSPAHSGSFAAKAAAGAFGFLHRDFVSGAYVPGATLYYRVYFYVESLPTTNHQSVLVQSPVTGTTQIKIQVGTDGLMKVRNVGTGTLVSGTVAVAINAWYRVEMRVLFDGAGAGQAEARLYNGDSLAAVETWGIGVFTGGNGTNESTTGGAASVNRFSLGDGTNNITAVCYFDDVAANDTTGSFQTSWCGPGRIALTQPGSDTSVQWTKSGSSPAATNFGGVNKVPGTITDGVTQNNVSSITQVDKLGLVALAGVPSNAILTLAALYARVGSVVASTNTMRLRLWDDGGTATDGAIFELGMVNAFRILTTAEQLTVSAVGKTLAQINAYSIGYASVSAGAKVKEVNALWLNVEYLPRGVGARLQRIDLSRRPTYGPGRIRGS